MLVTRSTFPYHYFPGAVFGLVALVLWLGQTEERTAKRRAAVLPVLALALFVWFYPATRLPVPRAWAASLKCSCPPGGSIFCKQTNRIKGKKASHRTKMGSLF